MDTYDRYSLLRDKKGYTDYRVCKLAGIETSTMSSWKTKRYEPKVSTLQKIASVLECRLADFYENNNENQTNAIVSIVWLEELEEQFNSLISSLGVVDIGTMKQIVKVSEHIEDARSYFEESRRTTKDEKKE